MFACVKYIFTLISRQVHLIQPHVERLLRKISVHLERGIDLFQRPVWLGLIVRIDVIGLAADCKTYVVHLVSYAFDVPYQVNPCCRRKRFTVDGCRLPSVDVIPDIPFAGAIEITLRAPYPAGSAKGLVEIEFQRLRSSGCVDIKIQVITEVTYAIPAADGVVIDHVRIGSRTTHAELRRLSIH